MAVSKSAVLAIIKLSKPSFKYDLDPPGIQPLACVNSHMHINQCALHSPGCSIRGPLYLFRSRAARLAYAIHAFFLARGATVVAVGQEADDADPGARRSFIS